MSARMSIAGEQARPGQGQGQENGEAGQARRSVTGCRLDRHPRHVAVGLDGLDLPQLGRPPVDPHRLPARVSTRPSTGISVNRQSAADPAMLTS